MSPYLKWIVWIVVIVAVIAGLIVGLVFIDQNYSTGQLQEQRTTAISGNYEEALSNSFPDPANPYRSLLGNPRVRKAIETNPRVQQIGNVDYIDTLAELTSQIESDNTAEWSNYRTVCESRSLSPQERRRCWRDLYLRKVALSLYVEVNEVVPWSILDYTDEELKLLLGDLYVSPERYMTAGYMHTNDNPLLPYAYVESERSLYPNHEIRTQKDLLDLTIIRMRADGWAHATGSSKPEDVCGYQRFDFECLVDRKRGSDSITSTFLYAALQSHNVPVVQEVQFLQGHTGIKFPSLGLIMNGNDVYQELRAGLLVRPNHIPIDNTYLDIETYEEWNQLKQCESAYLSFRRDALNYLSLYDDPRWNADVLASYCNDRLGYEPGEWLRGIFSKTNTAPWDCKPEENPDAVGDTPAPLTEEELDEWMDRISLVAEC